MDSATGPVLDEPSQQAFRDLDRKEARQEMTARRLRGFVAVLFVLFLVSLLVEALAIRSAVDNAARMSRMAAVRTAARRRATEAKADLFKLLPAEITGYATKSRHLVPGSMEQAEAIYEPEDMNLQLARPTTVYCQLTRFSSPADAEKYAQDRLADFPLDRSAVKVFDSVGVTGLASDRNAFAVLFVDGNIAVFVKSMFTQSDPVDKGTVLQAHGTAIAEKVAQHMREVKSGVVEDTGEESE